MVERVPITVQGFKKLEARLADLKAERPRIVAEIAEARAHGDLKENAEYHAARERQGMIEAEIRDAESRLARAEVIDPSTIHESHVVFGATVRLLDVETDAEVTYQIVGEDEVDLKQGRISIKSPIARALLRKEAGDEALVQTPKGQREYEILEVSYR